MELRGLPHVVVVPNGAAGHAIPFLEFIKRMAATGIVTTVVASDKHILELEILLGSRDLTCQGVPLRLLGLQDHMTHLSHANWTATISNLSLKKLQIIRLLEEAVRDVGSPQSLQLRGVQPANPPQCIVHDMFTEWAQEAAEALHIEKHLLYVSPACSLSCDLESNRLFQECRFPITRDTRDAIISGIPGVPSIPALEYPRVFLDASSSKWMRSCHLSFRRADAILLNTFYDLERPVLDALRHEVMGSSDIQAKCILDIGPLLPESHFTDATPEEIVQERDPCISWLNTRPAKSVLYVSFGSAASHSASQLVDLALGLEASECSFLWIVRPPDAIDRAATLNALERVAEYLPPGFEGRVKDRGMCYSGWAPQMRILKHPAIGGFLSHCGWNSTLETVAAGVPVLAWPIKAEQHLIRRFLVDTLRIAVELKGDNYAELELEGDGLRPPLRVSKEEIANKIRCLMVEEESQLLQLNIQKLMVKFKEAGALGGSSRLNFEAYVSLLHANHDSAAQLKEMEHKSEMRDIFSTGERPLAIATLG
ncbi:UDP-glycosyltransferase 72B1 [Physcomitrium patens]|uniref:Glycosyltransferase n=1 Tax=Physcomitrium patens TaxID=3218 RepID=A0A2K1IG01_PHYPA|nr:UDP-glycosyltransferase 72B1-like [Physcomitrium patens]XP_024364408.1 UDP-glycosyltransferase 72B1-like [Physcomitrium patens]PNR28205.1 hypothetical protein PHYPA_028797 [Physcomitrium patens]|eukprot:XP_024364407.1 UDP-glycosyltransferase 72B1-like [Physcomitrella patens]